MDRVCLKPPAWIEVPDTGGQMKKINFKQGELLVHNDMNLWKLSETKYQGGLALCNTPPGNGGFCCLPSFHKLNRIHEYRKKYEEGKFLSGPQPPPSGNFNYFVDVEAIKKEVKEISMNIGDFVIWNSRIPHANTINTSNQWRIQAFVRFMPDVLLYERYREDIAECVKTGKKPSWFSTNPTSLAGTGSENRKWEIPSFIVPKFTELGQFLHGLKPWK